MSAIERFNEVFASAVANNQYISFNPEWSNGTGYFDGAAEGASAPVLKVGELVVSTSPMPNNRKLIIVGSRCGNCCIFERYTDGGHGVYVTNQASKLQRTKLVPEGRVTDDTMNTILGSGYSWEGNIGEYIESLNKQFNE